ncbi:MAG TPA: hypothetical protein VLX92_25995 [Kofleriaceae bacterium]|nr:hypothetical protein [Kofleriaceae bacterium]
MRARRSIVGLAVACWAIGCAGPAAPPPAHAPPAADDDGREARRAQIRAEEASEQAEAERENGTCDDESYDVRRVACRWFCPSYFVANAPMCDSKCPRDAPAAQIPACQAVMACPTPPDRRVLACLRDVEQHWPACDRARPALANPRCDGWSTVPGTLTDYAAERDGRYRLHVAPCGNRGVAVGWHGHLRDTQSGEIVAGGDFEVVTASPDDCTAVTASAIDPERMRSSTRVWMAP